MEENKELHINDIWHSGAVVVMCVRVEDVGYHRNVHLHLKHYIIN